MALSLDPRHVEALHGLGLAQLEQGRHKEAEASFREAIEIFPELAATWACLAQIQAERGELETSCESARVALRFDPMLPEAYCRLAANLKGRLPDDELQAIERMLGQESLGDEMRASLHFCLGSVLDARGFMSGRPRSWTRPIGCEPRPGPRRADL